jgi:hypothetical protein
MLSNIILSEIPTERPAMIAVIDSSIVLREADLGKFVKKSTGFP